jgi:hypothetical protein
VHYTTLYWKRCVAGTRRFHVMTRRANTENESGSLSKVAVVMLLRASGHVRQCVATAVDSEMAESSSVGLADPLFKMRAIFLTQPQGPAPRPKIAMLSTIHARVTNRAHSSVGRVSVIPNSSCSTRRALFRVRQSRREAAYGRLRCTTHVRCTLYVVVTG